MFSIYMYLYDMLLFMMFYYGNTCLAENRMQCAKKKKRNREQVKQQWRESFQILISRTYTLPANCNITKNKKKKYNELE